MAVLTGRVTLDQSPNPVVPRYGLFTVANGPLALDVHARLGGLQYQTTVCDLPACYTVECQTDGGRDTKSWTGMGPDLILGDPFIIYSALLCGTVGLDDARIKTFLYDRLRGGEQASVENVFSRQSCGQAPGLSNNAAAVDLGTAANVVDAVSALENGLYANYGMPGVLHVPKLAAAYFASNHLIHRDGPIWRTDMGTAVSFGNYAGLDPAGGAPAAGATVIYITGQTTVWRTADSDLFVTTMAETLNRTTNTVTAVMEREYVVAFDCYVAGIETTLVAP